MSGPEDMSGEGRDGVWAIVVAGGSGTRFGSLKQFAQLAGRALVEWSVDAAAGPCQGVVLVVPATYDGPLPSQMTSVVSGGATRAASVRAGLGVLPADVEVIVVHDAARPLASPGTWSSVIAAVRQGADGAVPCAPVTDTVKQRGDDGRLVTLDRSRLLAAQTPQAFSARALRAAHARGDEATDDAGLVEACGGRVVSVPGDPGNIKVTSPLDLEVAELLLARGWARQAEGRR